MIPLLSEEPIAIWLERNRKNTESCWVEYVVENNVSQNEVVERNTLCKRELIVSLVIQGTRGPDPPRRGRKKKKKKRDLARGSSRRERCYDAEFFTSLWQGMDLIILMYPRKTSIRDKFPRFLSVSSRLQISSK